VAEEAALDRAAPTVRWDPPPEARRDWPWLGGWLAGPRGRRSYVSVPTGTDEAQLVAIVRAHLRG